jgi:hypothetical protein
MLNKIKEEKQVTKGIQNTTLNFSGHISILISFCLNMILVMIQNCGKL